MFALFEDTFIDVHKPLVKRAKRAEPAVYAKFAVFDDLYLAIFTGRQ